MAEVENRTQRMSLLRGAVSDIPGMTAALAAKQNTLVSGTSIKTINGESVLGSGDIVVSGGGGGATQVFMQATEPVVAAGVAFVWLQTGLGDGTDFAFQIGKGL